MTYGLSDSILYLHDRGEHDVAAIAATCQVTPGYVYGVLREHRPNRKRKPRERTGKKRKAVLGLIAQGVKVGKIADRAKCSRAYVHMLINEVAAVPPPPY